MSPKQPSNRPTHSRARTLAVGQADLHLHTYYSDGAWAPRDLVVAAAQQQLRVIAVTDHDTLAGVAEAQAAGIASGVEVIAGVEMTARVDTTEVHILGYFFGDGWQSPALQAVLDHARKVRHQRIGQFVARLNELKLPLTMEDILATTGSRPGAEAGKSAAGNGSVAGRDGHRAGGVLGRMHVAQALIRRGLVGSIDEAFERFLKPGRAAYVDRYRMTAAEAIGHIRRAGGVAVLAHPGIQSVDGRFRELADQGLDGLEVWHTKHSAAQTASFQKKARDLGLLVTGGSDCHGAVYGTPLLGTIRVTTECVEALRKRSLRHPHTASPHHASAP